MNRQMELEEQDLEDRLARGEISNKEFNDEMRELQRDYHAAAQEAAEEAYRNKIESW